MPVRTRRPLGRQKTTLDYDLFIPASSGFNPLIYMLEDVSLGDPQYEEQPKIKSKHRKRVAGRKVRHSRVLRKMRIESVAYEVNLPQGYDAIPELETATNEDCDYEIILYDPCEPSFVRIRQAVFDEIKRRRTPMDSPNEDGAPLEFFTMFEGIEIKYPVVEVEVVNKVTGFAVYGIDFSFDDCPGCNPLNHQTGVYAGGVAGTPDVGHFKRTSNQFASGTVATTALTTGHIVTQVLTDGNTVYRTTSDDLDPATATAGTVEISHDGGDNFTVVHTATEGLYDILYGELYTWVFGSDGYIARSQNGTSFTQLSNTVLPTMDILRADYDPVSMAIYCAGHNGTAGKAIKIFGDTIQDISTAVLVGTTKKLYDVRVLSTYLDDYSHIAFVGEDGFFSENTDAANSTTYALASVPTTEDIYAVEGDSFRTFLGSTGGGIFERAIYTKMEFNILVDPAGSTITGDIRCGATGISDNGVKYVAFGTSVSAATNGEVVVIKPEQVTV